METLYPTQNLLVYKFSTWLSDGSDKLSSIEILVVNRKLGILLKVSMSRAMKSFLSTIQANITAV